jgi:hypothetical protein
LRQRNNRSNFLIHLSTLFFTFPGHVGYDNADDDVNEAAQQSNPGVDASGRE